ncbi:hypothetical protein FVQ98_06615 [Ottowia sp. GY511]|uniref:PhaM family polyhydroxyalkanoate granule multifunctional regulatory protein n=1 Tax=Ottowia flava TaxID=2675430 RepID=A0ABW4KW14_9BURK|nr:PhaM family polyhydroxyalkanoate granule multifunctional regulatory protein [Ottowia sp. GY511]TXK30968.1 hypothetical protein FVQ98_06615 [Ottowia sp. GY511]
MSDANALAFGKFIPGFDFLQQLSSAQKAGGGTVPGLGQWVAPTVSVEELDRRITELKAVQFWLDQNATALKATVQALEVQKMTLATLQGMNVSMAEVAKAFTVPVPSPAAQAPAAKADAAAPQWPFDQTAAAPAPVASPEPTPPEAAPEPAPAPVVEPPPARPRKPKGSTASPEADAGQEAHTAAAKSLADGMQWWGALTQQFQQIAANALREAAPAKGAGPTAAATPAKPAGKTAAKKKPAAKRGAKQTGAARKKAATPRKQAAAREPAPARNAGWPLPPPAKPR